MKHPARRPNSRQPSWAVSASRLLLAAAFGLPATLGAQSPKVDTTFTAPLFAAGAKPSRVFALPDNTFYVYSGYENPFVGFDRLNGVAKGDLLRFKADGTLDTTFTLDAQLHGSSISTVAPIAGGKLFVAIQSITGTSYAAKLYRLNANGSVDTAFNPGTGSGPTGALIRALAVQADGKPLIGGSGLATFNGVAGDDSLRRLNTNGTVDTAFAPKLVNDATLNTLAAATGLSAEGAIQVQPDGKIIIVGGFNKVNGTAALSVARLNPTGTLDTSFVPSGYSINSSTNPSFVNYRGIRSAALQTDGKVILAGYFNRSSSSSTYQLSVRLNSNGSLDTTYNAPTEFGGGLQARLTPAGKLLLTNTAGGFEVYTSTGAFDPAFTPPTLADHYYGADSGGSISGAAGLTDGRVIIAGGFDHVNGTARPGVARLSAAGALDTTFSPGTISIDAAPTRVAVRTDGTILAAGGFATVGSSTRSDLALLNANGSLNAATLPVSLLSNPFYGADFLLQPDGKVFVYGYTPSTTDDPYDPAFTYKRLNANLTLDSTFTMNSAVAMFGAVLYQSGSGYLLSTGFFDASTYINSTSGTTNGNPAFLLHRIGLTGSPDNFAPAIDTTTFFDNAGAGNADSSTIAVGNDVALAVQPDGKILFKYFDLTSKFRLIRLTAAGALDTTFAAGSATPGTAAISGFTNGFDLGAGYEQANEISAGSDGISGLVVQPDGKLLVYGDLTKYNTTTVTGMLRLNANGAVDTTFSVGKGPGGVTSAAVNDLKVQENGKLLVVGNFTTFNGVTAPGIVRLNANGAVDTTFQAPGIVYKQTSIGGGGTGAGKSQLVEERDGSYLLTGNYTTTAGAGSGSIIRLTADGNPPGFFNGEAALSGGAYYLSFSTGNYFGYYSFLTDPHYIYHFDLGYEYVTNAQDGKEGVYLYDFASKDFFYTSPSFPFPYLYDFNLKSVVYYYPDPKNAGRYNTNGVRYFYVYSTGKIISK